MQDHHQKPEISSEEATPPAGNRMADAESAAKDKHRRASSQGEKVAGIKKSTSKSKNKSFFESHTDDRRQTKGITMVQKPR